MYIYNMMKTQPKTTPSGATVWWLLAEEDGAPQFEMRYFEIAPGRSTTGTPHPCEHEVYVTQGEGKIGGDDETVQIAPGDAVLIFPGERHRIINTGEKPLGFVCIIPKGKENGMK
jgi:quercetin dioxygenase-like cupin family protein